MGDTRTVGDYLDPGDEDTDSVLVLDIIRGDSTVSCCFTSGYHRYCEGTGSVLQGAGDQADLDEAFKKFAQTGDVAELDRLKLRYFTPKEISSMLGFPPEFSFPNDVTLKQKFKVLGNSLNVIVVSLLIFSLV